MALQTGYWWEAVRLLINKFAPDLMPCGYYAGNSMNGLQLLPDQ